MGFGLTNEAADGEEAAETNAECDADDEEDASWVEGALKLDSDSG